MSADQEGNRQHIDKPLFTNLKKNLGEVPFL